MTITSAPPLAPFMKECALQWSNTSRWPRGYLRFGRQYLWLPSPYLGAYPLMFPGWVLWER
jgi:hypothetical protein